LANIDQRLPILANIGMANIGTANISHTENYAENRWFPTLALKNSR
jgi:hypothetical protein